MPLDQAGQQGLTLAVDDHGFFRKDAPDAEPHFPDPVVLEDHPAVGPGVRAGTVDDYRVDEDGYGHVSPPLGSPAPAGQPLANTAAFLDGP